MASSAGFEGEGFVETSQPSGQFNVSYFVLFEYNLYYSDAVKIVNCTAPC